MKLAKFIPWEEFEIAYAKNFSSSGAGPAAMSVQIALGVLIIREKLGASDEETDEQVFENSYLKYFFGFTGCCDKKPFHLIMFVYFRKRLSKKAICKIIETVNQKAKVTTQIALYQMDIRHFDIASCFRSQRSLAGCCIRRLGNWSSKHFQ
ncbi:MAG: transposase [Desulfobacteraceae bacterium]|nr:transposase [Desulfobacteraceae bacterium]